MSLFCEGFALGTSGSSEKLLLPSIARGGKLYIYHRTRTKGRNLASTVDGTSYPAGSILLRDITSCVITRTRDTALRNSPIPVHNRGPEQRSGAPIPKLSFLAAVPKKEPTRPPTTPHPQPFYSRQKPKLGFRVGSMGRDTRRPRALLAGSHDALPANGADDCRGQEHI